MVKEEVGAAGAVEVAVSVEPGESPVQIVPSLPQFDDVVVRPP